jgi:hypothetical protein
MPRPMTAGTVENGHRTIDSDQLLATFKQLGGIGSVELKMNVPSEQRMALRKLHVDPLMGRIREVVFFDTPDLELFKGGVVVRGRRTQGKDEDTVVKLRPVIPEELPPDVRNSPNLKVELDITRQSYVVSASLKGTRPAGTVAETLSGRRTVEKLLTKEQRAFLAERLPSGVGWDRLMPLGPVYVVVLKAVPEGFSQKMTIEQWHFPGQVPLVELSTKTTPAGVPGIYREAVELLTRHGLAATGEQQPKTGTALRFFVRHAA